MCAVSRLRMNCARYTSRRHCRQTADAYRPSDAHTLASAETATIQPRSKAGICAATTLSRLRHSSAPRLCFLHDALRVTLVWTAPETPVY